jgi:mRNA interferase MazF
MYEQGEIIIVPFPFSDLRSIKRRPVLVLSKKSDNETFDDIITCGITSNMKDSKYSVLIENRNLDKGQIPTKSKIKVDKLFTLDKRIVEKSVGMINKETFNKVKKEFLNLL